MSGNERHGLTQQVGSSAKAQQQRHQLLEDSLEIVPIDAARRQDGKLGGRSNRGQCLQVVTDHFSGEILHGRELQQALDLFQIKEMLEAFKGLLSAPTLVIKVTEIGRWIALLRDIHSSGYCPCRVHRWVYTNLMIGRILNF